MVYIVVALVVALTVLLALGAALTLLTIYDYFKGRNS